jgi:hypothetical protein
MMEGDWIAMPGVPLIAAENPEALRRRGDGADAPGDGARAVEETTGRTSNEACEDRATGPTDEVERTEAATGTVSPTSASPGAAAVPEFDAAPAPKKVAPATVNAEEDAGGDVSEMAQAAELEAALLAAGSSGRESPSEPAAGAPAEAPVVTAEAEV